MSCVQPLFELLGESLCWFDKFALLATIIEVCQQDVKVKCLRNSQFKSEFFMPIGSLNLVRGRQLREIGQQLDKGVEGVGIVVNFDLAEDRPALCPTDIVNSARS